MKSKKEILAMIEKLRDYQRGLSWYNDEYNLTESVIDGLLWAVGIVTDEKILPNEE